MGAALATVRRAGGTVHICAADEDTPLLQDLELQLTGLDVTYVRKLKAGEDIATRRRELISEADMIVLLLSADFVASAAHAEDAADALKCHHANGERQRCVAMLARPLVWADLPYQHLVLLPRNKEPVPADPRAREAALAESAQWILDNILHTGGRNPFPGLRSFDQGDVDFFFGRDEEIKEALGKLAPPAPLAPPRWLLIEGPSGAGKSSLARAGIVPAVLAGGIASGRKQWVTVEMRPGHDPITNLAEALVRQSAQGLNLGGRHLADVKKALGEGSADALTLLLREALADKSHGVLLVVDQFEEIFTVAHANAPAVERFDALIAAALEEDDLELPFLLVTPLRNDFLVTMKSEVPALDRLSSRGRVARVTLHWMDELRLRKVIEMPAERAGLTYDDGLVDRIIRDARGPHARGDAGSAPGALPLVAHLLETLYTQRRGRTLTTRAYNAAGGVGGALAQGADAIIAVLGDEDRERARRLLLRLVTFGRRGEAIPQASERQAAVGAAGGGVEGHQVLLHLSGARAPGLSGMRNLPGRLVTVSGDPGSEGVDLVHVALVQRWDTLRKWILKARPALELRQHVEEAAWLWAAHGRDEGALPHGDTLTTYMGVERAELQDVARAYLFEANAASGRRADQERIRRDAEARAERLLAEQQRQALEAEVKAERLLAEQQRQTLEAETKAERLLAEQQRQALEAETKAERLLAEQQRQALEAKTKAERLLAEQQRQALEAKIERANHQRWRRRAWVAGLLVLLSVPTTRAGLLAGELETTKRAQIQENNKNMAAMFAGTLLSQLRVLGNMVETAAQEKELIEALQEDDISRLDNFCLAKYRLSEPAVPGVGSPITLWFVIDREGVLIALSGKYESQISRGQSYDWRDYFNGAKELADRGLRAVYVSRAYQSENEHLYGFSFSTPIYAYDGGLAGVLVANISSSANLGYMEPEEAVSKTVLVAPRDRERVGETPELSYLVVRHIGLRKGGTVAMENEQVRWVSETSRADEERLDRLLWPADHKLVIASDNYEDPMAKTDPRFAGNWLSAFAPVGGTGFVVIVQTPETEATRDATVFLLLAQWLGITGLAATAISLVPDARKIVPGALRWSKARLRDLWRAAVKRLKGRSSRDGRAD